MWEKSKKSIPFKMSTTDDLNTDDVFSSFATEKKLLDDGTVNNSEIPPNVIPYRCFMNQVDTYNAKHISSYIADQFYGAPPKQGNEEIQGENDIDEEQVSDEQAKTPRTVVDGNKFEIVGTLQEIYHKKTEDILFTIDETNQENFETEILKCGFIIYDITQHEDEIPKALDTLNLIIKHLDEIKTEGPKTYKNLNEERTFILLSTVLTWARTKPLDPDDPDFVFSEAHYKKRKAHPNYKKHLACEREVFAKGKQHPEKLKVYILCSGIIYGKEEKDLEFLFKLAWTNEKCLPVFHPGKNFVPLIHIDDLAKVLHRLMDALPAKPRYILAVEPSPSTLRQIVVSLSKNMGRGIVKEVNKEEALSFKGVEQKIYDRCTINIRMEPAFIVDQLQIPWQSEYNLVRNMAKMVEEFRSTRNLFPLKIVLHGPPASGKTKLAKKISEKYGIYYVSIKTMIEETMDELRAKINAEKERLKLKDQKMLEQDENDVDEDDEEMEEEEEEGEEEESHNIEELEEQLDEIVNTWSNSADGRLPNEYIYKLLREFLKNNVCVNQGYILDGFPKTFEEAKSIFERGSEDDLEEEVEDEEDHEAFAVVGNNLPDFVISLQATDEFLCQRIMKLPEREVRGTHHDEEAYLRRLAEFRANDTEDNTVLNFFDEKEIHPVLIDIADDDTEDMECIFQYVSNLLGEPIGFGMSPEEEREHVRLETEARMLREQTDRMKDRMIEEQAAREYQDKMEQWTATLEKLQMEEEKLVVATSEPLRMYLTKYVFPLLTQGLAEIITIKPDDPIDYLAEFLFRQNPEGKPFDPAYTSYREELRNECSVLNPVECRHSN